MIDWKWSDDGKSVTIDSHEFRILAAKLPEAMEYAQILDRVRRVYTILQEALISFRSGQASYTNARDRVGDLIDEIMVAERDMIVKSSEIASFFDPPTVCEQFSREPEAFRRFLIQALERIVRPDAG